MDHFIHYMFFFKGLFIFLEFHMFCFFIIKFFIVCIILLFILIAQELYSMLGAFLGAITLYVLLRNMMVKLVVSYNMKKWLAALLLIIISLLIIVLPSIWIVSTSIKKVQPLLNNPTLLNETFEKIQTYLLQKFNIDILNVGL